MILQYFKKKENKEQIIAAKQYKKIISESNIFLNENNFFKERNYKTSFEIVSIFLIMFIRINLLECNRSFYLKVNDELVSLLISDLDESLRAKGIGDISIGKYVKSYVIPCLRFTNNFKLISFIKIDLSYYSSIH